MAIEHLLGLLGELRRPEVLRRFSDQLHERHPVRWPPRLEPNVRNELGPGRGDPLLELLGRVDGDIVPAPDEPLRERQLRACVAGELVGGYEKAP